MGYRTLELNVVSAKHLKDVNFLSKMDVYVVASISGGDQWSMNKKQKAKSHVDRSGGSNPTWNFPVHFTVDESLAHQNRLTLVFEIKSDGILGDKKVGEVIVQMKELLDSPGDGKSMKFVSYQVRTPSGKPKGELHFSYKFTEAAAAAPVARPTFKADEPVMAYPAPGNGSSSSPYVAASKPCPPPPPSGYAYAPPPPSGYAYPPSQGAAPYGAYPPQSAYGYPPPPPPGYGYPGPGGYGYPPAQKPPKKNGGMGFGAGLLGGMLGGLLLGDIVSDAVDCDVGDFDF